MGVQRDGALTELVAVPFHKLYTSPTLALDELALVEPFSVGFHAANRGRVRADDTVLVVGCGGVGLGAVAGAVSRGARVIAMDAQSPKLALATALGAQHVVTSGDAAREQVMGLTNGDGPDVVIEAVGSLATYRLAVEWVKFCGRVVYIGYGKELVPYETKLFVQKELDILGARNCLEEFTDVISFFEKKSFDPHIVVSHSIGIDEVPDALAHWVAHPGATSKIMVNVSG